MSFHDTELRYTHPELFRHQEIERNLAASRLNARPGARLACSVQRWLCRIAATLNARPTNSRPGPRQPQAERQA